MSRRKKKKRVGDETPAAQTTPEVRTPLGSLLKSVALSPPSPKAAPARPAAGAAGGPQRRRRPTARPATQPARTEPRAASKPSDTLRGHDLIAFRQAMAGVRPLRDPQDEKRPGRVPAAPAARDPADEEARQRLAALVGGGMRFDVEWDDDGSVRGIRSDIPPEPLRQLRLPGLRPDATIDLHGLTGVEAETAVTRFVRAEHRRGRDILGIIHGKGLHSKGPAVLVQHVVRALSEGGAAPVVLAFRSARPESGGTGTMLVHLDRRF